MFQVAKYAVQCSPRDFFIELIRVKKPLKLMLLFFLSKITNDSWPENLKTAVTIPKNLLLSDSGKSVLSKDLNFVPAFN